MIERDIVEVLRLISGEHGDQLGFAECQEAAAEITRLRAEVARLRLTKAEREAIKSAIGDYEANDMDAGCWQMAATLRALLARLGGAS